MDGFTIEGADQIAMARLLTLRAGLKLETKGMRMTRGISCYKIIKDEYGFKGNKLRVLDQVTALIEDMGILKND